MTLKKADFISNTNNTSALNADITPRGSGTSYRQGIFTPKHPEKYVGDADNVVYRSSWELEAFRFCDNNPNVIKWASEEIAIPYLKPTFRPPPSAEFVKANYFPDLYIEYKNVEGEIQIQLIEIKPEKQTRMSRARKPQNKQMEDATFMVNKLKWAAAEQWCSKRNIQFRVCTEKHIFR